MKTVAWVVHWQLLTNAHGVRSFSITHQNWVNVFCLNRIIRMTYSTGSLALIKPFSARVASAYYPWEWRLSLYSIFTVALQKDRVQWCFIWFFFTPHYESVLPGPTSNNAISMINNLEITEKPCCFFCYQEFSTFLYLKHQQNNTMHDSTNISLCYVYFPSPNKSMWVERTKKLHWDQRCAHAGSHFFFVRLVCWHINHWNDS